MVPIDELVELVQFVGVRVRTKAGTSYPVIWWMYLSWIFHPAWCVISLPRTHLTLLPKPVLDYIEKKDFDGIPELYQLFP